MNAPKISKDQILAAIEKVTYTVMPDERTTICSLSFCGGRFTIMGNSTCVSKENFNKEMGEKIAYENAINECWKYFGFMLAVDLHRASTLSGNCSDRMVKELDELQERLHKLTLFLAGDVSKELSPEKLRNLTKQREGMVDYEFWLRKRVEAL